MSVGVLGINAGCRLTVRRSFFLATNPAEDQDIVHITHLKTPVANLKTSVASRSGHLLPFNLHNQYYRQSLAPKTATFSGAVGPSRLRMETYRSSINRCVTVDCTHTASHLPSGCHSRSFYPQSLAQPFHHQNHIFLLILPHSKTLSKTSRTSFRCSRGEFLLIVLRSHNLLAS
jgi:hypothetical protein